MYTGSRNKKRVVTQCLLVILGQIGLFTLLLLWGTSCQCEDRVAPPLTTTPTAHAQKTTPTPHSTLASTKSIDIYEPLPWSTQGCIPGPDERLAWMHWVRPYPDICDYAVSCDSFTSTYDLSWTPQDRYIYAWINYPQSTLAQDAVCTLTISSGDYKYQKRFRRTDRHPTTGCDRPVDTIYLSDVPVPQMGEWQVLPEGGRTLPSIAILKAGFAGDLARLLLALDEPVTMVEEDFDPLLTVESYPILLIPSGGLFGLENSHAFRARLEEYVRQGGTLVAFSQQHGYEYLALPTGEVNGRGWRGETGCFNSSVRLTAPHLALSGFDRADVNIHTRGYFTVYPPDATVLLTRPGDDMPTALIYPYGRGQVIATSIYEDWLATHGQGTADAHTLIRTLVDWVLMPDDVAVYTPGDIISLPVAITNQWWRPTSQAGIVLVNPNREIVQESVITASLERGDTIRLPFTSVATRPLGLWRVDVAMFDGYLKRPMFPRAPGPSFLVVDPPAITDTSPTGLDAWTDLSDIDLDVSAALDRPAYGDGETAMLTLTITNRSSIPASHLQAVVRHGEFEDAQPLNLTGDGGQTLSFAIPIDFENDVSAHKRWVT
jgi:hypothetical protein